MSLIIKETEHLYHTAYTKSGTRTGRRDADTPILSRLHSGQSFRDFSAVIDKGAVWYYRFLEAGIRSSSFLTIAVW